MRRAAAIVLALCALRPEVALAWDPFSDELDAGAPEAPSPAPFAVPDGLYLVTDVYAGDVVSVSGPRTTYSTTTVRETPGTYARAVATVGTGEASAYDGASFNGRAALADGRSVAGTYYEDFVLTDAGYVSVNIVFFQDDSIFAAATPASTPSPAVAPSSPSPGPASGAVLAPAASPAVPTAAPGRPTAPAPTTPSSFTAGIALGPTAPVVGALDILRARTVRLWARSFINGGTVPVARWRVLSAGGAALSAMAGTGAAPLEIAWPALAPAGSSWDLRVEVASDAAPGRVAIATLTVTVRSPALLQ